MLLHISALLPRTSLCYYVYTLCCQERRVFCNIKIFCWQGRRAFVTYKCFVCKDVAVLLHIIAFFSLLFLRLGQGAFIVQGISRVACMPRCILFSVKRLSCACRVCNTHLYSATERKPNTYNDYQVTSDGE